MLIPPKKVVVSLRAVCKDFVRPNGTVSTALEGVNFDIYDGEFLSILGLSGSGKSTLLRCLAGVLKPDRGNVSFSQTSMNTHQNVSMAFQNSALFPWLNVRQNIELGLGHLGKEDRRKRVDEMLIEGGLSGFDDVYPRDLNSGMRQRVNLFRAVAANPLVLLMDEPFSGLDPLTGQSLMSEVERLWSDPDRTVRSVVLATHNVKEAVALSDRIIIMSSNPGRVYRTVEIQLPRPRNPNLQTYERVEQSIEKIFGELHLDRIGLEEEISTTTSVSISLSDEKQNGPSGTPQKVQKRVIRPIIKIGMVVIEGLVSRLSTENEPVDIYDLCEDMGQSTDQMLHAVASAEILGLVTTPGTNVTLTSFGRAFVAEQEPTERMKMLREALLRHPLIAQIYATVRERGNDGISRAEVVEQIYLMLPFEDPDAQFEALIRWCRHADLFNYDLENERIFIE